MQQLDFLAPIEQTTAPRVDRNASIDRRFAAFHRVNPHVYQALVAMALQLKRRGWKRAGMKQLFEKLRWDFAVQTNGDSFTLNNDFTSRYARLLMQREPELRGFFEVRDSPRGK